MAFSTLAVSCNHHLYLITEYFHHPKKKTPYPLSSHFPLPPHKPRQPLIWVLSLWIFLFWTFPINGIVWYVAIYAWLPSLSTMLSRFIHVSIFHSSLWLHNTPFKWGLPRWLSSKRIYLPAQMLEMQIRSLGGEDPLEKEMATHSSILAWEIPWAEEPGGPQSMGLQRVRHFNRYSKFCKSHGRRSLVGCSPWGRWGSDTTEQLHFHFSLSCIGEGNGNPLQRPCLENPRDGGAWWAAVYGVAQSCTWLNWLSSSSSSSSSFCNKTEHRQLKFMYE